MHDYALYFAHWDLILSGADPWAKIGAPNAYGPLYNFLALPYALHSQLPKLIFAGCWLAVVLYTIRCFCALSNISVSVKWLFAAFWLLNPFFIVSTVFYGFNDSLVALLCFLGVIVAAKGNSRSSLMIITAGVLTKIYPLFLLPFLDKRWKNVTRNIAIFITSLLLVYLITYFIWGPSFLVAFGKANGREPTLFSIMMFFYGDFFPFKGLGNFLISLNKLLVLGTVFYLFKRFQNGKLEQHTAFLAGFTAVLMFYKAGQQQFYLSYFAIFAAWVLIEFRKELPNKKAFLSVIIIGAWMMLMAGIVYPLTGYMSAEFEWVRHIIGLPTFILLCISFKYLLFPDASRHIIGKTLA
ncbi:glycosyltransferase 87 family protein [Amphritea pacifica]|uniref:glycosyltransferase 87 family protein n=1 Tax=Amphritea pacifica TaxID=2811233 RepID=UPI001963262B|nr:hypothetical protein [Amphritea pacifica]MBN1009074.1 hypothetical protein [Amphritea pacifica]